LLLSRNQEDAAPHQSEQVYRTNVGAERRIEELQKRLADIEVNKLDRILQLLEGRAVASVPSSP
jgi:hypothetical protein